MNVVTELLTDDGELSERGVEYANSIARVVREDHPQNRHEQQKERKYGHEHRVRQLDGEIAGVVVAEFLYDTNDEREGDVTLLEGVDASRGRVNELHIGPLDEDLVPRAHLRRLAREPQRVRVAFNMP